MNCPAPSAILHPVLAALLLLASNAVAGETWTVTTVAGKPVLGHQDGAKTEALFYGPNGLVVTPTGVTYVADSWNHVIRMIATDGTVTTIAGSPGINDAQPGIGTAARFREPRLITRHPTTGVLYVADDAHVIWSLDPVTTTVAVYAGSIGAVGATNGTLTAARFYAITGLAFDSGGTLYVSEAGNHTIRKISTGGIVSTVAGLAGTSGFADATGTSARFSYPQQMVVGSDGNLYVADYMNMRIRKIVPATSVVTTLAGNGSAGTVDGTGTAATFSYPMHLARVGTDLFLSSENLIRRITLAGVVSLHVNTMAIANSLCATEVGNLRVSSGAQYHHLFDVAASAPHNLTTFAGLFETSASVDGNGSTARFWGPFGITAASDGTLFLCDSQTARIRRCTASGEVTTLTGTAGQGVGAGAVDGDLLTSTFGSPRGIARTATGDLYLSDRSNHTIRKIAANGTVTTIAGLSGTSGFVNASGNAARFSSPGDIAIDQSGNLFVIDTSNRAVRKITPTGVVTTLAGTLSLAGSIDGTGVAASFSDLRGITIASGGNLFVTDGTRIRRITSAGEVTTIAGGIWGSVDGVGTTATFNMPSGILCDGAGTLFVVDRFAHTLRRIVPPTWTTTTLAGTPERIGQRDGVGANALFAGPTALAYAQGSLFITDYDNNTIRKVTPSGATVVPPPTSGGSTPSGSSGDGSGGGGCGVGSAVAFLLLGAVALIPLRQRRTLG